MRPYPHAILALLAALAWTMVATHYVVASDTPDFLLCRQATSSAEHASGVPDQLLGAISRVETGRYDPGSSAMRAWPWTINAEGQGHFYRSRTEAVEAARQFRARGIQSIDVGCTQINLMFHPDAFASLDEAFDPARNAAFAAKFLTELFHQEGSWPHAAAAYHSQTPELGTDYQRKVLAAWSDPIADGGPSQPDRRSGTLITDFHRQITALSPDGAHGPGGLAAYSAAPAATGNTSPPLGGFGRIIRNNSTLPTAKGRTLSAYRAMPVAMLTTPPHTSRY